MKTERFDFLHLLFGVLCGFLLGSTIGEEFALTVRRMLFAGGILFFAFFWRRIESMAHSRHLRQWDDIEPHGKWYFIFTRYVLVRGAVFVVLLLAPAITTLRFTGTALSMLVFAGSLLIAILLFLGHEEWRDCEQEMQILALRQTGEFIASQQN